MGTSELLDLLLLDLVALKFALIPRGVLSVMTTGTTMMLVWRVNNLDTLHMVSI